MTKTNKQAEANKMEQRRCPSIKRDKLRIDVEFELGNEELSSDMIAQYNASLKSCWEYVIVNTRKRSPVLLTLGEESGKETSNSEDCDEAA